jgi:ribosome biogenesis protein NSA1
VATAAGQIELFDLKAGKMSGALKGSTGSVRALIPHPELPLIASAGLDRYLRLHDTSTRKQVAAVYLKQHLTGVTFCPAKPVAQSQGENEAAAEMAEEDKQVKVQKKRRRSTKLG